MSKTVLNEQAVIQLIHRVMKLTPTAEAIWGRMTVDEMLYHCNLTNNEILHAKPYSKKPKLKQLFLKFIVMHLLRKIPRRAKINSKFLKQKEQDLSFEAEKKCFIERITQFSQHSQAIYGKHPVFGRLSTKEWQHFVWMHMDHHLRQFGV